MDDCNGLIIARDSLCRSQKGLASVIGEGRRGGSGSVGLCQWRPWCFQVVRIDGTMDSPPCLKVTHKTFGTQNSSATMVYCRLSMPVECHSSFSHSPCLDSEAFQKR